MGLVLDFVWKLFTFSPDLEPFGLDVSCNFDLLCFMKPTRGLESHINLYMMHSVQSKLSVSIDTNHEHQNNEL